MDDFEELINEFTDDHLDDDVDPSIGEDDLLQELSEMIDSWEDAISSQPLCLSGWWDLAPW